MTFVTSDGETQVLEATPQTSKGNTVMRMKLRDVRSGSTIQLTVQKKNSNKLSSKHVCTIPYKMVVYTMDTESYEHTKSGC